MIWHVRDVNSTPMNPKTLCGTKPELHPIGNPGSSSYPMLTHRSWVTGSLIDVICSRCRAMMDIEEAKKNDPVPF